MFNFGIIELYSVFNIERTFRLNIECPGLFNNTKYFDEENFCKIHGKTIPSMILTKICYSEHSSNKHLQIMNNSEVNNGCFLGTEFHNPN